MNIKILSKPLNASTFKSFGDVIDIKQTQPEIINNGNCLRYDNLACLEFLKGKTGISIFDSKSVRLPYTFNFVERHPEGSQAFIPMYATRFLMIVAKDKTNSPERPQAFIAKAGQGVNIHRGIWHGVLSPIDEPGLFAVIDRIGSGNNLENFYYDKTYEVC